MLAEAVPGLDLERATIHCLFRVRDHLDLGQVSVSFLEATECLLD
jgi:hypothetical protein